MTQQQYNQVSVRPAKDTKADRRVLYTARALAYAASGEQDTDENNRKSVDYMMNYGFPYIIQQGHKPVGGAFIQHYKHNGLDQNSVTYSGGSIDTLGIFPKYQGHGIASSVIPLLIAAAQSHYPEGNYVHIAYDKVNGRAGALYQRLGFASPIDWSGKNGWDAVSLHKAYDKKANSTEQVTMKYRDFEEQFKQASMLKQADPPGKGVNAPRDSFGRPLPTLQSATPVSVANAYDNWISRFPAYYRKDNPTVGDYVADAGRAMVSAGVNHGLTPTLGFLAGDLPELLSRPVTGVINALGGPDYSRTVAAATHEGNPLWRAATAPARSIQENPEVFAGRTGAYGNMERGLGQGLTV